MKKKVTYLLVLLLVLTTLTACTPKNIPPSIFPEKDDSPIGQDIAPEEAPEPSVELGKITAQDKVDLVDLTLLNQYEYTLDNGLDTKIAMYTDTKKDANENVMWDDGQRWLLIVEGKDKDYVLFDDFVQLGTIDYHIYTEDHQLNILTTHIGTANLTVSNYKYDHKSQDFLKSTLFNTRGNVNMLHRPGAL